MKSKYKNTFWFTVVHSMKKNFIIPLLLFAYEMLVYLSDFCWDFIRESQQKAMILGTDFREIIQSHYEIYLTKANYHTGIYIITPWVVIASAILGIMLFRFVTNKKTVNVYYSLGIKRSELYGAKLTAGAIMMLLAALLPLGVSTCLNLYYFGSSLVLWKVVAFYAVHYVVCVLAGLTIAAAVSSCVGTTVEAGGFTAVLIAFPSVATLCLNYTVPALLYGAPKGFYYHIYPLVFGGISALSMSNTVAGKIIATLDLLLLNRDNFAEYSCVYAMDAQELKTFAAPSLTPYILWTVLIVCFAVFGLIMFNRRKAEICGFTGRSIVLNSVLSAIVTLGCATLLLGAAADNGFEHISVTAAIAIIIVASFGIFLIIDTLLHLNIKSIKKDWKIGFIHAAVTAAILISISTGFFGYSSRLPEVDEVASISVTAPTALPGSYTLSQFLGTHYNSMSMDQDLNYYYLAEYGSAIIEDFTSKEDITAIRNFHKKLIDANTRSYVYSDDYSKRTFNQSFMIKYKLKNGKEMIRYYSYMPLTLFPELYDAIGSSDNWSNKLKNELLNIESESVIPVIFSQQMDEKFAVEEDLTAGLAAAMYKDIVALGANKIYSSDKAQLGSIGLQVVGDIFSDDEEDVLYEEDGIIYAQDPHLYDGEEEELTRQEQVDMMWTNGEDSDTLRGALGRTAIVPITEDMTNTITYLKAHGLYEKLIDTSPIVSARVARIDDATSNSGNYYWIGSISNPIFNSFWEDGTLREYTPSASGEDNIIYDDERTGMYMPESSTTVTDKATIDKLITNAYSYRFDLNGGYLVEFKRENGHRTIMLVPSDRVDMKLG